jgi:hypothetical protein
MALGRVLRQFEANKVVIDKTYRLFKFFDLNSDLRENC